MTEQCDIPEIRKWVQEQNDPKLLKEYEEMVKDCNVGDWAETKRAWIPLCDEYPNLKGLTCKEINDFVKKMMFDEKFEICNQDMDTFFDDSIYGILEKDPVKEYLKRIKVYDRDEMLEALKRLGWKMRQELRPEYDEKRAQNMFALNNKELEDEIWGKRYDYPGGIDSFLNRIEKAKEQNIPLGMQFESLTDDDKKYLSDVGSRIIMTSPNTIFVTTPRGGHEILSIFAYANNLSKAQLPSDIRFIWDEMSPKKRERMLEQYMSDMLESTKTRVINMPWRRLDPDIKIELSKNTDEISPIGATWHHDMSQPIKDVIIVDDIVASGAQMDIVLDELRPKFPNAKFHTVHLCGRSFPRSHDWLDRIENRFHDTETSGIRNFRRTNLLEPLAQKWKTFKTHRKKDAWNSLTRDEKEYLASENFGGTEYNDETLNSIANNVRQLNEIEKFLKPYMRKDNRPITCLFPHACPDGESDKIISKLMGDRCSPANRIARRDM